MDNQRYEMEKAVFSHYMPSSNNFQFGGIGTSEPWLRVVAQTQNNHVYVLRMILRGYPDRKPDVYVECMLKDHNGHDMDSASGTNHTLTPHSNGWTQICHYHPDAWQSDLSLWLVYMKCVVWLNIYEQSLRSGRNIDYYLNHMGANFHY